MTSRRGRLSVWVIAVAACTMAGCHLSDDDQAVFGLDSLDRATQQPPATTSFRFGIIARPTESPPENYVSLIDSYLEEKTGLEAEVVAFEQPKSLIASMRAQEIDIGIFPALIYVKARRQLPGLRPLATATQAGSPTYLGYFVVRRDSSVNGLEGLRGKSVAFVSPTSTSGYLYPKSLLQGLGYDASDFFSHVVFAGSHTAVTSALVRGEVDAGALGQSYVDRDAALYDPDASYLRVVAKTAHIPFDCVAAGKHVGLPVAARVRAALLALDGHHKLAQRLQYTWGYNGFVRTSDRRYDVVEEQLRLVQEWESPSN